MNGLITFVLGMWAGGFLVMLAGIMVYRDHPAAIKMAALLQLIIHGK
ncbi:hypothetical protein [uncultured Methanomethylovorans sp.]|nr:hypothetical protein [uncultured Methanomethylovorans sp.]